MLTPALPRLWFCAAAAFVLACAGTVRAQFRGGDGDGFSRDGVASVYLSGDLGTSPAYFGTTTGGDGYSVSGTVYQALNGSTLPAALFTSSAGGGDGYDAAGLFYQSLNGTALPAAVFVSSASGGDGYDASGVIYQPLNGTAPPAALYTGSSGGGDGYDGDGIIGTALDISLAFQFIFSGGTGDGYDRSGVILTTLDGATADPSPFVSSAGGGDGYDVRGLLHFPLDGTVLPAALYVSSSSGGDGYDFSRTSFVDLSGATALAVAYLGDIGDGYDEEAVIYTLLDPMFALPNVVFRGSPGDGYDTRPVPYIYYLGEGGVPAPMTYTIWRDVHFTPAEITAGLADAAADADRDGLPNIIEYTTGGDPRTADAGIFGPQFRVSDLSDFGRPALPDKHLTAIVRRDPRIFDAALTVEFSSDTISLWNTGDAIPVDDSVPSVLIVRDRLGVQDAPTRLLRLRATLQQP